MKKESIAVGMPNKVLTYEEELKEYNDYWASPSVNRFPPLRPTPPQEIKASEVSCGYISSGWYGLMHVKHFIESPEWQKAYAHTSAPVKKTIKYKI